MKYFLTCMYVRIGKVRVGGEKILLKSYGNKLARKKLLSYCLKFIIIFIAITFATHILFS